MKRLHRSAIWLATLAFVGASVTTASAVDPKIMMGGYYQQTTDSTSKSPPNTGRCLNVKHCWFVFSPVPAGKQLIATNVNCQLGFNPGTVRVDAVNIFSQRSTGAFASNRYYLQPTTKIDDGNWNLNTTVLVLIDSGERPLIEINIPDAVTEIYGACAVAGQLIDAPAP